MHDDFDWMQAHRIIAAFIQKFGFTDQLIRNSCYMFNIQVMNQSHDSWHVLSRDHPLQQLHDIQNYYAKPSIQH